jgi:hypothetical protein
LSCSNIILVKKYEYNLGINQEEKDKALECILVEYDLVVAEFFFEDILVGIIAKK